MESIEEYEIRREKEDAHSDKENSSINAESYDEIKLSQAMDSSITSKHSA